MNTAYTAQPPPPMSSVVAYLNWSSDLSGGPPFPLAHIVSSSPYHIIFRYGGQHTPHITQYVKARECGVAVGVLWWFALVESLVNITLL